MPDTGFNSPSANENNSGVVFPQNMYASDNSRADFDEDSGDNVTLYTFGISIPAGSQIDGIEVTVEAILFFHNPSYDAKAQITPLYNGRASSASSQLTGNFNDSTEVTLTVGGSSDLWGRTWTVGDFSNTNFGINIEEACSVFQGELQVDHVAVKVYYTEAGWTGTINGVTDP
jgi:hypothetical protein